MYICIDFDGTIVEHVFPEIGEPVPHAIEVMKELQAAGHELILHTMRSNRPERQYLEEAVLYCKSNNIQFFGINSNPTQSAWTSSPKTYGHLYIDDAALGCPLITPTHAPERRYVDWLEVGRILVESGCLPEPTNES